MSDCFVVVKGFGDVVPGTDNMTDSASQWKMIGAAVYIVFGMAIMSMAFNLIQEEIVSKFVWLGEKLGIIDKQKDEDEDDKEPEVSPPAAGGGAAPPPNAVGIKPPPNAVPAYTQAMKPNPMPYGPTAPMKPSNPATYLPPPGAGVRQPNTEPYIGQLFAATKQPPVYEAGRQGAGGDKATHSAFPLTTLNPGKGGADRAMGNEADMSLTKRVPAATYK